MVLKDVPVLLPPEDELVFTERNIGQGLQAGETELPDESAGKKTGIWIFLSRQLILFFIASLPLPQFNEAALSQLEAIMGFPTTRCQKSFLATGNNDPGMFTIFVVRDSC